MSRPVKISLFAEGCPSDPQSSFVSSLCTVLCTKNFGAGGTEGSEVFVLLGHVPKGRTAGNRVPDARSAGFELQPRVPGP